LRELLGRVDGGGEDSPGRGLMESPDGPDEQSSLHEVFCLAFPAAGAAFCGPGVEIRRPFQARCRIGQANFACVT